MDKLVNYILGLEPDLWQTISDREKGRYRVLVLCFLVYASLSLVSSLFLGYMISSSLMVALAVGLMLSFVAFNIVRFSLVILRRSVFPSIPQLNPPTSAIEPTQVVIPNWKTKVSDGVNWIKQRFNWRHFLPGLGGVIRMFILSIMCLLVVFPLTCLMNRQSVELICDAERTVLLDNFKHQKDEQFRKQLEGYDQQLLILDNQLMEAEQKGIQNSGLASSMRQERGRLQSSKAQFMSEFEVSYNRLYTQYARKIEKQYFVVKCFSAARHFTIFPLVLLVIFGLVFYAHFVLIGLKNKNEFLYAERSTEYYRSRIEAHYQDKQAYLDQYLKNQYPDLYPTLHKTKMYANPPYCNIKNQFFQVRTPINKAEFEAAFNL